MPVQREVLYRLLQPTVLQELSAQEVFHRGHEEGVYTHRRRESAEETEDSGEPMSEEKLELLPDGAGWTVGRIPAVSHVTSFTLFTLFILCESDVF